VSWVKLLRSVVLTSIAIGAALGVISLVGADLGETGWKVVATSFLITATALVAMPSVAAWERDRLGALPMTGIVAAVVGFAWVIAGMWSELESETLWKIPVTLIIYAVGVAAYSLLEVARLSSGQRWLVVAARAAIAVVGLLVVVAVWAEIDSDGYWRGFGVAAIVMTALLAAIPVLHRSQPASSATTGFCPVCGAASEATEGVAAVCPSCGTRYVVDL
jgi:hypothetical protein